MGAGLVVRDAQADELPALAAAVVAQPLLVRYGTTAPGLASGLGAGLARGESVLVLEEDGVGHGLAWVLPRGTFGDGAYLKLIALVPGHEGKGRGQALLRAVEARAAATSRHLFLLVSHWNEGARRFYAREGYREVGVLPAHVRPDTDEVVLHKRVREG